MTSVGHERDQTHGMHQRAMRQITDVFSVCLNSTRRKEQWACLRRDKQLELYAKRTDRGVSRASCVYYLAVNEASCGFDETLALFDVDSTAPFCFMMQLVHGRNVRDGTILACRSPGDQATRDTHHAAIRFTYHDPRKSVLQPKQELRFFQTVHVLHPRVVSDSYDGPVSTTLAVHKRTLALNWLPYPRGLETVGPPSQVDLHYTLIVEEIASHRLRLSCVTSSFSDRNDGPMSGSRAAARAIARRLALQSVEKLESAVVASRVGTQRVLARHEWVHDHDRTNCVICWKKFSAWFRRRHHCRLCGEVVCASCCAWRIVHHVGTPANVSKTRVCHLCCNHVRTKTPPVSSNVHRPSRKTHAASHETWHVQDAEADVPLLMDDELPACLKRVASPYVILPPPSPDFGRREHLDATSWTHDDGDGYIGTYPKTTPTKVQSKILSIKTLGKKKTWCPHSWSHQTKSNDSTSTRHAPSSGYSDSRSYLHPAAKLHKVSPMACLVTDESSYSSESSAFFPSYEVKDATSLDDRRTSLMSSTIGLLEHEEDAAAVEVPKLDARREDARLALLDVLVSPACTLIDRTMMHQSCTLAATVFQLSAAFIARVDAHDLVLEHVFGACPLSPQDHVPRSDTLCDFVLCQPMHEPFLVRDCVSDPRTRTCAMVHELRMRAFIGINICVRNLPIACLCAYDQHETSLNGHDVALKTSVELLQLETTVDQMEQELERLVHGVGTP
ncbi:hypothetical protein PsorP6_000724 [Peronosclerospora sorghi]|uniref:Uncharacterized protein n=1 Tax=Peronosclerospora sorghi TaxID=230839 RepID=A0ACC0WX79_9STRA|nr:hypothetical protein PsorP6_000724 [Peronosclerospora sorghi]